MNFSAFILILISVFLHAGWNFLSKANRPSQAFYLLANLAIAVLLLPFLVIADIPFRDLPWHFYLIIAGSVVAEVAYATGLCRAYSRQDISVAYPMARALPVMMVAVVTLVFGIGKTPGVCAWIGFAVVACGCVILPQKSLKSLDVKNFIRATSGAILLAAIGTTGYTVLDKVGTAILAQNSDADKIVQLGAYLAIVELFTALGLAVCVWSSRREMVELRNCWKTLMPYLCGVFSGAAYLLVLTAMELVSNVTFLQAFRQMSLPLAVAAGVIFLHEKLSCAKVVGTVLIVSGLILTVL